MHAAGPSLRVNGGIRSGDSRHGHSRRAYSSSRDMCKLIVGQLTRRLAHLLALGNGFHLDAHHTGFPFILEGRQPYALRLLATVLSISYRMLARLPPVTA